jgi:[acyl-carrier-protein] S-malonyltransferase
MMLNTAFVFPGQGSQSIGMLAEFAGYASQLSEVFTQASDILGYDLWELVEQGPAQRLNQTEQTQVAMLTADIALYRLLLERGIPAPQWMAGHSLGEYAALVAAEALTFADAVRLVSNRGKIMQNAMPIGSGAMAAIVGLTDEQVEQLCQSTSVSEQVVCPANYNAIGQVVVAGHKPAVERVLVLAEEAGARLATMIPVSVPCHCPLLTQAAESFAVHLNATPMQKPLIPVISNVDLSCYDSPEQIRTLLKKQLYSPVRWVETIQLLKNKGVDTVIECGPGKVLSGLIKRIDKSIQVRNLSQVF